MPTPKKQVGVLVSPDRNEDFRRRDLRREEKSLLVIMFIAVAEFLFSMYTMQSEAMVASAVIFVVAIFATFDA